jgi:hypothetical protein
MYSHYDRREARYKLAFSIGIGLVAILFAAFASAATLEVVVSNPPSFKQLKVQYGTCTGTDIAVVQGTKIVDSPASTVFFTGVTPGVLCIRAVWSNEFGDSPAAKALTGPPPDGGQIITVKFGP